mgnify:CR=1 FL=1
MPRKPSLIALLTIASLGVAVASCETPGAIFPPADSLRVEPKPVPPDDVLPSRIAGERHDNAVEAWGEKGWSFVAEQCRFWKRQGMDLDCPPPPERPDPG